MAAFAISFYVTLLLIDHSDLGQDWIYSRSGAPCAGPRTLLKRPFASDTGFAVQAGLPQFKALADSNEFPSRSKLILCENRVLLGPPHSQHIDIRSKGLGRYSHWNDYLLFSASDNTDPRTNMREYAVHQFP